MEYAKNTARDIGLSVPGDPYRTFYALTRLADQCAADVVDDRWRYESAVLGFHDWAMRHVVDAGLTTAVPSVSIRTNSLGAEGHTSEWYDTEEAATDEFLSEPDRWLLTSGRGHGGGARQCGPAGRTRALGRGASRNRGRLAGARMVGSGGCRAAAARRGGPASWRSRHAQGGQANETILVDLGAGHPGMVVRLPPLGPTFPEYDLGPQAMVQNTVASSGVPAPAPAVVVTDPEWIGSSLLAMPRVAGDIPGPAPLFDPYVRDAGGPAAGHARPAPRRRGRRPRRRLGSGRPRRRAAGGTAADAVERWIAYVAWSSEGDPLPALAQALDWCARHAPRNALRSFCGVTSAWATSCSTPDAVSPRSSIGTSLPSAPGRWTSDGTSASSS